MRERLEFAHAVPVLAADPIDDAPILDLRLRKGIRRHGVRLVQAGADDLRDRQRASWLASCARRARRS